MVMRLLTSRWVHTLVLLGILAGAVTLQMREYSWTRALSYLAFDTFNRWHPRTPTDKVVMVDIDESSMDHPELGQWPWPRDKMADLVTNLHALGARAIVFDMVFPEPDRTSPAAFLDRLPAAQRSAELTAQLSAMPDNDDIFADAIRRAGNVVTAFIWTSDAQSTRRTPPIVKPVNARGPAAALTHSVPSIVGAVTNIPPLSAAAAGEGSFGVIADIDGIIRRVPLLFRYNDPATGKVILYPSLAIEALRVYHNAKSLINVRALKPEETTLFSPPLTMKIGNFEVPFDWDSQMIVYFAPARPHQYIPAWRVITNQIAPERIAGKIVFVGTSAEGLKDIRSTPLNLYIPGGELHINIVEQILSGDYLQRPEIVKGAELIAMIGLGCLIIILAPFIGAVYMALFTLTLIAGISFLSWYSFETHGLLIDPVYFNLCLLGIFIAATLLTYVRTEYERARVRQAFGLYISPDFMNELTRHPEKLKLGGETRELTVMFTDIRGFTTISESMSPAELTQLMNDFLTPMSDLVMETRGTIDKYMGDAMMAFWNAPLDDPDHARHACLAALRMAEALAPVNAGLQKRDPSLSLNAGIGLHTGPASVGNMGSRQRFAYSALGDTVNLASRLEGQTKAYGVNILISAETCRHIPDFATLDLDLIRVKGKSEPVRVFTIAGDASFAQSEKFMKWQEKHNGLRHAYQTMNWDEALALAEICGHRATSAIAPFYDMIAARIKGLQRSPPPADWDGVYTATSK